MKDNDRNRAIVAEVIARVWRERAYRDQLKKIRSRRSSKRV